MIPKKSIGATFDAFVARYGSKSHDEVFYDIIDCMMHVASAGKEYKETYAAAVKFYGQDEIMAMISYIAEQSDDFFDAIGEMYEYVQSASKASRLGQFFTPQPISEMIATMVGIEYQGAPLSVSDPTGCGSGRNVLAMAKRLADSRWQHYFHGVDIDAICVKMTVINCWLQAMPSMIIHGNGLDTEYWTAYEVVLNWHAEGGKWCAFVIRQPEEVVAEMLKLQQSKYLAKVREISQDEWVMQATYNAKLNAMVANFGDKKQ